MISVAITTFNRSDIVGRAIQSALDFVEPVGGKVVVVDDCSTDETERLISSKFTQKLKSGTLAYFRHHRNLGVTAAKNTAFDRCPSHWVLFLDSDDELIQETAAPAAALLKAHDEEALVFFRCVDETGAIVGQRFDAPQRLTLPIYATHASYGEALVAINKAVVPEPPFDADLQGYEGVGCARLIKRHGPALLATIVARRYYRVRKDRLSSFKGTLKRARYLARGHLRYISICGDAMRPKTRLVLRIKALAYFLAAGLLAPLWSRNG